MGVRGTGRAGCYPLGLGLGLFLTPGCGLTLAALPGHGSGILSSSFMGSHVLPTLCSGLLLVSVVAGVLSWRLLHNDSDLVCREYLSCLEVQADVLLGHICVGWLGLPVVQPGQPPQSRDLHSYDQCPSHGFSGSASSHLPICS